MLEFQTYRNHRFDLTNPKEPDSVGVGMLNYASNGELWDPNTSPTRVESTPQGVAVLNMFDNIEIFTPEARPVSTGVVQRIYDIYQNPGRCNGGVNHGESCIYDFNYPPLISLDQCPGGVCVEVDEFVDAAFFDGFAVTLERDGIRTLTLDSEDMNDAFVSVRSALKNEQ